MEVGASKSSVRRYRIKSYLSHNGEIRKGYRGEEKIFTLPGKNNLVGGDVVPPNSPGTGFSLLVKIKVFLMLVLVRLLRHSCLN